MMKMTARIARINCVICLADNFFLFIIDLSTKAIIRIFHLMMDADFDNFNIFDNLNIEVLFR